MNNNDFEALMKLAVQAFKDGDCFSIGEGLVLAAICGPTRLGQRKPDIEVLRQTVEVRRRDKERFPANGDV